MTSRTMRRTTRVPDERTMAIRSLAFAGLFAAGASAAGAQSPVDATVNRAAQAWSAVKTVRGTFEQTVINPLTGSSASTTGTFVQQRPNRLAIRFSPPTADEIVADGRSVWIYLPSSAPGQVIKRSATTSGAVPLDLTGQFLDDPLAKYTAADAGTHPVDGHAAHGVTLVPKAGHSAPFTTATVWIDDDDSLIRDFSETESSGVQRHVHLTRVELNVPVDKASFTFAVPRGVKVVDQTKS
jgi:outer membrane lipoprotein carrier protein